MPKSDNVKARIEHLANRIPLANSQGSDISNFIESDQKVAPYHLVVFKVMTPKSDFLLIRDNNTQGFHEHIKLWKNVTVR